MIKVSDLIVNFFLSKKIDTCFTVTGGGAMHLNDSFGHHKSFKCIYNHHEQACSMAAEGYTRISGKPAVVCVTSGPATTNTLTGVMGSWLDSIPMIIISGQMKLETTLTSTPMPLRQLGFQEFNIIDCVSDMTKYAVTIINPELILYHLEKAYFLATSDRKGPVWLDIPLDIQSAKVDLDKLVKYDFIQGNLKNNFKFSLNKNLADSIVNKINLSKRPVIIAGYEIRMDNSQKDFLKFVEMMKIPVVTEWNSNDLIEDNHEFFAGRPGTIGTRGGNFVVQNADLLLVIGCQLSIRQVSYVWKNFAKSAFVINVNSDKYEIIKPTLKVDMPIHCNSTDFINFFIKSKFNLDHKRNSEWHKWTKKINKRYPVVNLNRQTQKENFISVYTFMKYFSDCIESKSITVLANGAACVSGLQVIEIKNGQRLYTNAGASSMGYAICAAIGSSQASPNDMNIYCIEGDGSIQMNIQELQTIVHNQMNIKLFWINNDGYHSIKQTQIGMFNASKKGFCGADKQSGISFPSAEKIANAYEIKYFKIKNIKELSTTLEQIKNFDGPVLCEVITDPNEIFEPKLQSKMLDDGTFYTPSLEDMYPFLTKKEMELIKSEIKNLD